MTVNISYNRSENGTFDRQYKRFIKRIMSVNYCDLYNCGIPPIRLTKNFSARLFSSRQCGEILPAMGAVIRNQKIKLIF